MTKEITKANIIQEIQDKFKLRELIPEKFVFSEMVIPTYNVEEHLTKREIVMSAQSITATGGTLFYTVPENENWYLTRYVVIFMGAGGYTVAGVYINRYPSTETMYLDLSAAQTVSYAKDLPKIVELGPKDRIFVNIDGFTSVQSLRLTVDLTKVEIR